jgi:hypothetical protein
VAGSGQTGYVCATKGTLLETWVVIFFLRGGFLTTPESAGSMAQRDNRLPLWVLGMHHPAAGAKRRCPMQPNTPLGPDQVNVILFYFICLSYTSARPLVLANPPPNPRPNGRGRWPRKTRTLAQVCQMRKRSVPVAHKKEGQVAKVQVHRLRGKLVRV